jgi:tripartite-type tricarboxylate transporter receptor subunit TctC
VKVINRAGGGGVVGFDVLRQAKPDGYTIGLITAQVITANIRGVMPATYKDFTNVAMINIDQAAIAVPASSPWKTLMFIKARAARHDRRRGGNYHMMARNLEETAGIKVDIPFNGGPAASSACRGHINAAAVGAVESPRSGARAAPVGGGGPEGRSALPGLRRRPHIRRARHTAADRDVARRRYAERR